MRILSRKETKIDEGSDIDEYDEIGGGEDDETLENDTSNKIRRYFFEREKK